MLKLITQTHQTQVPLMPRESKSLPSHLDLLSYIVLNLVKHLGLKLRQSKSRDDIRSCEPHA